MHEEGVFYKDLFERERKYKQGEEQKEEDSLLGR